MARKKLRDIALALGLDIGCGDNSCYWGSPGGMATNGGCRCRERHAGGDRILFLQMQRVAQYLLDFYNVQVQGDANYEQAVEKVMTRKTKDKK